LAARQAFTDDGSQRPIFDIGTHLADSIEETGPLLRNKHRLRADILQQSLRILRAVERRSNQIHLKATPQEPQQVQHAQGSPTLPVGGRRRSQKQETLRHDLAAFFPRIIRINPPV